MKKIIVMLYFLLPVVGVAQINESDTLHLQMRHHIGGNWQEGNFEIFTFRLKSEISTMLNEKWVFKTQNNYLYQEVFKKKADEDIFSRNYLYFSPQSRVYAFAIAFISTNFRRKINLRYFGGTGGTWQVIRTPQHLLKIAAGLLYETSHFNTTTYNYSFYDGNPYIRVWRSSHWLIGRHNLWQDKIVLNYYCFWQPSLQRADNYRWQIETSVDFALTKGLFVGISHVYGHENVIARGLRNYDSFFTYQLSYQFKK